MNQPIIGVTVHVDGVGDLGVADLRLPHDSILCELEPLRFLPPSPSEITLIDTADPRPSAWATWRSNRDIRTCRVSYRVDGDDGGPIWVDIGHDDADGTLRVEMDPRAFARNALQRASTPLFAVKRLLELRANLDPAVVEVAEHLKLALSSLRDGRRFTSSPQVIPERFVHADDGLAKQLARGWAWFGATLQQLGSAPERTGLLVEHATRAMISLESGYACNPTRPLHHALEVSYELSQIHRWSFAVLGGIIRKHASGLEHIPRQAIVAGLREQLAHAYQAVAVTTGNSDVVGAIIEQRVRRVLGGWVHPWQVTSGEVAAVGRGKQIDSMIWDNRVAPSLMREGDIAVIHPAALKGIVEIKTNESDIEGWASRIWGMSHDLHAYRQSWTHEPHRRSSA